MVMKAKSDEPIKPLRNVAEYTAWNVPSLELGNAPSFLQPAEEEEEEELSEEAKQQLEAEELERIKEQARQEGFQQGQQEGLAAANNEIDMLKESISNMILQLAEPVRLCREKTQQQLMQLSFAVARQIVRRELKQDPTQIIAIIREALKLLPVGSRNIVIGLHPEDEAAVSKALSIDKE
ncbi:MAG: FliH/SctL family protein, partial [Kangiellaceae bacterium]|nr:FliH/SctL family protein [Kangiellaceae bacterium]